MTTPDPEFRTDRQALANRLRMILPAHCLLVDEEDLRPYECDGLTAYRELPLAVCLPETEGQVIDVLRTCHQLGVPVVVARSTFLERRVANKCRKGRLE